MIRSQSPRRTRRLLILVALAPAALTAAACSTSAPPNTNVTIPATGLVVLSSDYATTSISLVDPMTRAVVHDACVDSNTVPPTLSLVLSGDVVLPSAPQAGGDVLLIDDVNKALTWVDPQTCTIRHQLSVSDFKSFPHDVISISREKAYVTRFGTNPAPTGDPMSRGEDLLIVNPGAQPDPTIVGRIDLAPFAAPVDGSVIQARPDRGLLVDGKVYVTLASQSADYMATGEGRIVIVDTATDVVSGMIPLTGLAGCEGLDYLAETKTLFVACGGASSAADQSATSGIAVVDLGVDPPVLKKVLPASLVGGGLLNFFWIAALSEAQVWASTFGVSDFMTGVQTAPDALWSIDSKRGVAMKTREAGAYNIGRPALLHSSPTLFLPDGDMSHPLIHIIDATGAATPVVDLDANPSQHLPPRDVAWY